MIHSITAINVKNEKLEMMLTNPWASGINVKNITGISPVGAEIYATEFGMIDGGMFSGARIPNREIVLTLGMTPSVAHKRPLVEQARMVLYNFFRIKDPMTLLFKTDGRYIQIEGYVKDADVDIFSEKEDATVTIHCVDPWFYSPLISGEGFHGIRKLFRFPFSNESLTEDKLEFGSISIDTRYSIFYEGDISIGFRMSLSFKTSNFHNIYLYNMETRERLNIYTDQIQLLTGSPLSDADELIINTTARYKGVYLVRDGITKNALSVVGKNSDWFKLSKGNNVFAFASDYGVENIEIDLTYQNAYYGI